MREKKRERERGQVDSFTRPPRFERAMPHSHNIPDPVGSRFTPSRRRGQTRGGSHSSGPSETTGSRIPLVSAAGTTNRQRVEKLSRPSSTSFLIRFSPLRSVDQTKESEKRPTTSEFQEPLSRHSLFLSLFLSSHSLCLCPLCPLISSLPRRRIFRLQCLRLPTRTARSLSLCLSFSLAPSLAVENIDVALSGSRIAQRNPRHLPR